MLFILFGCITLTTVTQSREYAYGSRCDFSQGTCGWTIHAPWHVANQTLLPCPLNLMPTRLTGDGNFLLSQGRFGATPTGDVVSAWMKPDRKMKKLSFRLSKRMGNAQLRVLLRFDDGEVKSLDKEDGHILIPWKPRTIIIPATEKKHQIVLRAEGVRNGFDVIAIDDVMISSDDGLMSANHEELPVFNDLDQREIRRSPAKAEPADCTAIKCDFKTSACSWRTSSWELLKGKLVAESGTASMESEHVIFPMNAHFQLEVFASDGSSLSIYERLGNEEVLLWTQTGLSVRGWNKIRIPLRFSTLPSTLQLKSVPVPNGFVAVARTNVVDGEGRELACGLNTPAIRPMRNETGPVRLTAIQTTDDDDNESQENLEQLLTTLAPSPTIPVPTFSLPTPERSADLQAAALLPISPTVVSSGDRASIIRANGIRKTKIPKLHSQTPIIHGKPPQLRKEPTIPELVRGGLSQTPVQSQLLRLAKKFGISSLSDPRAVSLMQTFLKAPSPAQSSNLSPISPVNQPKISDSLLSALHLPPSLNGALTTKLAQMLQLPKTRDEDSRPFRRQNLDFVVQNAYQGWKNNPANHEDT